MDRSILILGKDEQDIKLMNQIFANTYDIVWAHTGLELLGEVLKPKNRIAAIMMDIETPELGGKQILETMKDREIADAIPVVVSTDNPNMLIDAAAYSLNACAVIRKPYTVIAIRKQIIRLIDIFDQKNQLKTAALQEERKLASQNEIVDSIYTNVLDGFMIIMEYNNISTKQHLRRIKSFTRIIGYAYIKMYPNPKLNDTILNFIIQTSVVYDIGMMAIPDSILHKPSRLTPDEREIMKSHTTKGVEILEQLKDYIVDSMHYETAYEIVRWHHERIDGNGYPDGLSGADIPISAQLIGFAEVYDALVSDRIYKKAYDKETAYKMIMNGECGTFSNEILRCFDASRELMEVCADKEQ